MGMFGYQFFINALLGVILISVAAAMVGTYIVTRRMVAISGWNGFRRATVSARIPR